MTDNFPCMLLALTQHNGSLK